MPSRPCNRRLIGRQRLPRSAAGVIGLVELLVVVAIISMLMMAAIPTYERIKRKARAGAVANDFRVFAAAFQAHAHEAGAWPPEAAAGDIPTGMNATELNAKDWQRVTPIGGKFDWDYNQVHPGGTSAGGRWTAAIAIASTSDSSVIMDADLLEELDRVLDDGNLSTGNFRLSGEGGPLYILER